MTTKKKTHEKRSAIEAKLGVMITHRRGYDAAGNNVQGWYAIHPSKQTFLGRTLDDAAAAAGCCTKWVALGTDGIDVVIWGFAPTIEGAVRAAETAFADDGSDEGVAEFSTLEVPANFDATEVRIARRDDMVLSADARRTNNVRVTCKATGDWCTVNA